MQFPGQVRIDFGLEFKQTVAPHPDGIRLQKLIGNHRLEAVVEILKCVVGAIVERGGFSTGSFIHHTDCHSEPFARGPQPARER